MQADTKYLCDWRYKFGLQINYELSWWKDLMSFCWKRSNLNSSKLQRADSCIHIPVFSSIWSYLLSILNFRKTFYVVYKSSLQKDFSIAKFYNYSNLYYCEQNVSGILNLYARNRLQTFIKYFYDSYKHLKTFIVYFSF